MSIDDQLARLRPLSNNSVAMLCGYRQGGNQISGYRAIGRRIPRKRLLHLKEHLEHLAEMAAWLAEQTQGDD